MAYADRFRLVWTPFLKKKQGKMFQALGVVCPPVLGSGGELTLHVGAKKYTALKADLIHYPVKLTTQNEERSYLWLIPRLARPTMCKAVWKTPLGQTYRDSLKIKPADPSNVHIIFKTHLDLGYTHRIDEVIRLYQTRYMETLLDNLDKTADRKKSHRFVWTLSTWLMERCLDPSAVKREHLQRLEAYIRKEQVVWGLMPFTTHSEFFGLEEMCRSLYASRRLAEKYKVSVPRAAKMTDVPSHTASLAMAFASAGGIFFQIGTNPDCMPPQVPPLFWWELPDGNRLLVHYHETYGTPLMPPPDWPYRDWLSIQITSDNVGPQNLELLDLVAWLEKHFDYPVCKTGRLEDFATAVIKQHGKSIPTVEKEFTDWWIHGIGSQARPTAIARSTKDRLPAAETVDTLAAWASGKPVSDGQRDTIRQAFEKLTLYTEHTWGDHATDGRKALPEGNRYESKLFANGTPKAPIDRWVGSWEDKARFATDAGELTDRVESQAIKSFAAHLSNGSDSQSIMVLNPVSWARGGLVSIADENLPSGEFELIDASTGGSVYYERSDGKITFLSPKVPACGYLMLDVKPVAQRTRPGLHADWQDATRTMHTSAYSLWFHEKGGMSRWHDRSRSSQWCSDKADFPMGTYLYEMPGGDRIQRFARSVHTNYWEGVAGYFNRPEYEGMKDFGPVGGGKAKISHQITPLFTKVVVEAECPTRNVPHRRSGDAQRYRTTFVNYRDERDLHVNVSLTGKRSTYAAEAGYAFFPIAGDEPYVLIDRIAHYIHPEDDLAANVNAAHMAVHRGVRVEQSQAGLNFYPLHTPLISFGKPGAYCFDSNSKINTGIMYANLFNNCWGTNFAQWQGGDFSYDFVLRPTGNDDWDGGLARGGAEVYRPLVAQVVRGRSSTPSRSLLQIDPPSVQLVALKPAEFESGFVIRLWNADVDSVRAKIRLADEHSRDSIFRCDLLERAQGKPVAAGRGDGTTVKLAGNEIATFLLKPQRSSARPAARLAVR